MRTLCCDQAETLTQGYYSRVGDLAVDAAPRRREYVPPPAEQTLTKLISLSVVNDATNDGRVGWFAFL